MTRRLVSMREYARHRGVTVEAVSKAVKAGRIATTAGKKVDIEAADRAWSANTQPGQMAAKRTRSTASRASKRRRPKAKARVAAASEPGPNEDPNVNTYASARARREDYLARMAQVDFEQKSGVLINATEFKAAYLKLITEAKTRLLAVPTKCKSRLPALSALDISIIEDLIRDELEELASGNG